MIVSKHAAERFMEKTGCNSFERAYPRLQNMFKAAKHVTKIRRGSADDIDPDSKCEYYAGNGWVFVMDGKTMVTCYQGSRGKTFI